MACLLVLVAQLGFAQVQEAPGANTTSEQDTALADRISQAYDHVDGLEPVRVEVDSGIVTLSGEVVSEELRERAIDLGSRFEGVLDVQDNLAVSTSLGDRIGPAMARFEERTMRVVYSLPLLIVGLVILWLAWVFARWLSTREWIGRRLRQNPFMADIVRQLVRAVVMVGAMLFVLDLLELTALVGAVLGAAGVATLAIGFAFRDLIENYIASVLLSVRQPFEPNDLVHIGDHLGKVTRLTSRATVLITPEGNHVRIPNATVFKAEMVNYSRNPQRRFQFDVGVDVELELLPVQSLAERIVGGIDGVLDDPAPFCLVMELGDSSVILRVFGWVDQREYDFGRVRSEAIRQVKEAFDEADIVMPEPIYNIKMLSPKAGAESTPNDTVAPRPVRPTQLAASEQPKGADTRSQDEIAPALEREAADGQNLLDEAAEKE
ncbi:mechanosensitive ion channel family protein [Marinihelvus fidelis]|uniref:mechanosensitive ion channel family protein n=1 Tax=Marinihelvus fidelis TaxID=2613842 RepID=UPI00177D8E3E|nr:mechanosensitive ion channel family protein [Marinihelvus fidelis]